MADHALWQGLAAVMTAFKLTAIRVHGALSAALAWRDDQSSRMTVQRGVPAQPTLFRAACYGTFVWAGEKLRDVQAGMAL
jgi:hypothetical protein